MNNQPLVSVIISVFNDDKNIESSIKSILNQSYQNIEICVLDDGSTDETFLICNELKKNHNNIKLYKNQQNEGLTKSLNFLIDKSTGYFIARQDSDDISYKNRIFDQVYFLKNNNLKVCTSRAKIKNSNRKIPKISFYFPTRTLIKFKNPFIHGTLMIEKSLLLDIGKYNEKFKYAQDYMLFAKLTKNNIPIGKLNKVLYELNMKDNISTKYKEEQKYFSDLVKEYIKEKLF